MAYDSGMNPKGRTHAVVPESVLKEAGLRATKQRIALVRALAASSAPRSVEALVEAGKRSFDTATAYRMLDAFQEAGLARRIELAQGRALYEYANGHHHHAVCTVCGRIKDVEACLPSSLDERVRVSAGFARINDHALEFFGICAQCAKKQ